MVHSVKSVHALEEVVPLQLVEVDPDGQCDARQHHGEGEEPAGKYETQ